MIFDGRPTSEITPEELAALVRDGVEESPDLDFKACPYTRDARGTHELVKDVSAFANAQGGYLIIGIGEESGNPRRAHAFVSVQNPEGERSRMINVCFEKIEPRFPELDIRAIEVGDNTVLVCHVHESDQKPHCAKPDSEHHFFWRRYEDGNRLMSVPEIRACLEGDRVLRELSEIRREFGNIRHRQIIEHEADQEITENNVFELTTIERFRRFVDDQFELATERKPYYRLTATPLPVNQANLRSHSRAIVALMNDPPELRPYGWGMAASYGRDPRVESVGVVRGDIGYKHLRVLWNGHVEFWTEVDDFFFRFSEVLDQDVEHKFLYPYAISEPIENFILFVREVCRLASFEGELKFRFGFYQVQGFYLAPGHPQSRGYMLARSDAGREHGTQPFPDANLLTPDVQIELGELPNQVTWRFVSNVYQRFGYPLEEQVPFFDQDHHFTLGEL